MLDQAFVDRDAISRECQLNVGGDEAATQPKALRLGDRQVGKLECRSGPHRPFELQTQALRLRWRRCGTVGHI